jgi:hypothetical protein
MRALAFVLCAASGFACSPQTVDAISSNGKAGTGGQSGPASGSGGSGASGGSDSGGSDNGGSDNGGSGASGGGDAGASAGVGGEAGDGATLRSDALLHRYSFDGMGTVALDSKGGAHGTVIGTELVAEGTLVLAGLGSGEYLDLPDSLVSGLGDATFEVWVNWSGGNIWQRIFDFGDNFEAPNGVLSGHTYLFLTPRATSEVLRAAFSLSGAGEAELVLDATTALPEGELAHVALVVDDQNDLMSLYLNGALESQVPVFDKLSGINDVNNWLGKSQFGTDAELGGTIHEFRIYDAALDAAEIQVSFDAGPQAVFPSP